MKHVIIILNYNDWKTTKTLVTKIRDYQVYDKIIVVDNASSDDSVKHLKYLESDRMEVIVNSKNEGYASGNNFGIFYALHKYHPDYLTIANPDIFVEESVIIKLEDILCKHKEFGMSTALVHKGYNAWKLPGYVGVLQSLFPLQRFLKKYIVRKKMERSNNEYEIVDVIEGSMFCVKAEAMEAAGGFDNKTFLYVEENLLAARMRKQGYYSVLLPKEVYYHYHSVSVGKHYKKKTEIFRFIQQSYRIYCQDYLHINKFQNTIFDCAVKLAYFERMIFDSLKKLKHDKK